MQLIKVLFESVVESLIRFFNNRCISDDSIFYYRTEIDKFRQRNEFLENQIINLLRPKENIITDSDSNEVHQPLMAPIESMFHKRQRLERETLIEWNKQVVEAQEKLRTEKKSTEDLEAEAGIKNGTV